MTLQVVGAGLGRTGTVSLRVALERLLGAPCYHMVEVFAHLDDHVPVWHAAVRGEPVDWEGLLGGYRASVDWPASAFWRELADAYPGAIVLLSVRDDAETWWRSADRTVFATMRRPQRPELAAWEAMIRDLWRTTMSEDWDDPQAAMAAYERHNADVRATVPADRLVEWRPGDGWEPLCTALGLAVPDDPFPHENTTAEFRAMANLDGDPAP
jgi:sulfotransferase family protein